MTDKLPQGWVECELGDVLYLQNGFAFNSKDYSNNGINIVRISDIQNNKVSLTNSVKYNKSPVDKRFIINKGDFLIAMSGATTGKTGIYMGDDIAYLNQRVGNLKILSEQVLLPRYRDYFIANKRREIEKKAYGGAQPNISKQMIEGLVLLLPPLNEQKRIVVKIEEEFGKIDEGTEILALAQEQIKQYKQSVLKSAFEGKLYKTTELQETIFDNVLKYEQPTKYIVKTTNYDDSYSTPVLTAGKSFIIGYTNETEGICKDIPVIIFDDFTTSSQYVDFDFKVKSSAMKILHATEDVNIKYLYYYMQTINHNAETHKRYWISEYSQKKIYLPKKTEQQQIVKEIEKRFEVADEVERVINDSLEKSKQLKQSILKKAFEGRLVPQDPTDEPASKLLEKIKSERNK